MRNFKVLAAVIIIAALFYFGFLSLKIKLASWYLGLPQPKFSVVVDRDVMVPSTDGTLLATDIYRPAEEGKFPVIIARTPYGKRSNRHRYPIIAKCFAAQGFVFIVQDVRGKYQSEGDFIPYYYEAEDGFATVEWAGKGEWSNGNVSLYGFSYLGSCAWLAATKNSPYLKTIVPLFSSQNSYDGWYDKGVPYLKDMLFWISRYHDRKEQSVSHSKADEALKEYPAVELDSLLNGKPLIIYQNYLHNLVPGPFWEMRSANEKIEGFTMPVLSYSGWYDRFTHSALQEFLKRKKSATTGKKMIIGPWVHDPTDKIGDLSFPDNADFMSQLPAMLSWFNATLKEIGNFDVDDSPIVYYVMGRNEWRNTSQWPPEEAEYEEYFLDKGSDGLSGMLKIDSPVLDYAFSYSYDPDHPTPSLGSHMIYANGLDGPRVQNSLIEREDVVTFSTDVLQEEIEVTGPLSLILYVSSSAVDTDFCAKLVDRHPDGNSYFVQMGYLRMRYRNSLQQPELLTPGEVYEVKIEMNSISHVFKKGHQIQLLITSSDYPHHSRNLNTKEIPEMASEPVIAEQKIYCGREQPSRLILPVVKNKRLTE